MPADWTPLFGKLKLKIGGFFFLSFFGWKTSRDVFQFTGVCFFPHSWKMMGLQVWGSFRFSTSCEVPALLQRLGI